MSPGTSARRSGAWLSRQDRLGRGWLDGRKKLDLPKRLSIEGKRVSPPLICSISNGGKGRPLHPGNVRAMLKRTAERAELEKRVHMHGLRHFHAFMLAQKGVKLHHHLTVRPP